MKTKKPIKTVNGRETVYRKRKRKTRILYGRLFLVVMLGMCLCFGIGAAAGMTMNLMRSSGITEQITAAQNDKSETVEQVRVEEVNPYGVNYYFRSTLGEDERQIYDRITTGLYAQESRILLKNTDSEQAKKLFHMVGYDHPEIFWIGSGFSMMVGEKDITLKPFYRNDSDETVLLQKAVDARVEEFMQGIPEDADTYEKVKYAYEWIDDQVTYVPDSEDNQNILSALLNGESVCAGYAKADQLLLQRMGIDALYVHGESIGDNGWGPHGWVMVNINGTWYHVDPTYGDGFGQSDDLFPVRDYTYLCISDGEILRNHTKADDVVYPVCPDISLNYYVQHGRYSDTYDWNVMNDMDWSVYSGERVWVCQFSNREAYEACINDIHRYAVTVSEYLQASS